MSELKIVRYSSWSNRAYMKSNDRERMEAYICEYDGECKMYSMGKCVCETIIFGGIQCPHSKIIRKTGVTPRAKSFGNISREWEKKYSIEIKTENAFLCECGDYVYIPINYLEVYGKKVVDNLVNKHFIERKDFNVETVHKIISYKPRALMGGEISSYQKEEVPKFIRQLKDIFPEMYLEYITKYPEKKELAEKIVRNFIGRKAYLITLNDGTKYIDCHRNEWIKNGNTIICESMRTGLHYVLGNKPRKCIQEITDDAVIEVTSNDFVNRDTKFVD